jgi:hypothetical protein
MLFKKNLVSSALLISLTCLVSCGKESKPNELKPAQRRATKSQLVSVPLQGVCPRSPESGKFDASLWSLAGVKSIDQAARIDFVGLMYDTRGNASDKSLPILNCYYAYANSDKPFDFYLEFNPSLLKEMSFVPMQGPLWNEFGFIPDKLLVCNEKNKKFVHDPANPLDVIACSFELKQL